MKSSGITLASGSSLVGAQTTAYVSWNYGQQGLLLFESSTRTSEVQLVLKSPNGTDIVMNSSLVLGTNVALPLSLPAGSYAIKNVSSSAIGVHASLHPTP